MVKKLLLVVVALGIVGAAVAVLRFPEQFPVPDRKAPKPPEAEVHGDLATVVAAGVADLSARRARCHV